MPKLPQAMGSQDAWQPGADLPDGPYLFRIDRDCVEVVNPGKAAQHEWHFVVADGEYAGGDIRAWFQTDGKAVGIYKSFMIATGINPNGGEDTSLAVGRLFEADVAHEEWQGKTKAKVRNFRKASRNPGSGPAPSPGPQLVPAAKTPSEPVGVPDSEIPF